MTAGLARDLLAALAGLFGLGEVRLAPGERRRPRAGGARAETGARAEDEACRHLTRAGYRLLCRNRANAVGELDIVAMDRGVLVFVEVRSRRVDSPVLAEDTLTPAKRKTLARAAQLFARQHGFMGRASRVDLVAVGFDAHGSPERVEHLRSIIDDLGR